MYTFQYKYIPYKLIPNVEVQDKIGLIYWLDLYTNSTSSLSFANQHLFFKSIF